jgi:mono/diheme cytochrome c family protein
MKLIGPACALAASAVVALLPSAFAENKEASEGRAIYARANCVGCHKWHGGGGGGYGGAALSLRKTELDEQQIVETVTCGRPGTGMPYFMRDAYSDDASAPHPCYGLTKHELGDVHVAEATIFLQPAEIEAVAAYVLTTIKGKGEPTLQECVAFFGDASRVCENYKTGAPHKMPTPTTTN